MSIEPETEDEICEMYQQGVPVAQIADELLVGKSTIYNILKNHGLTQTAPEHRGLTEGEADQVVDMYQRDIPVSVILRKFHLSYNTMYRLLGERGVDVNAYQQVKRQTRQARMDLAVQMYEQGYKLWEIQQHTGIYQPQLHAELHSRGIKLRNAPKEI